MTEATRAEKYRQTLEHIHQCALSAGRDPLSVRLVVVTKGHSAQAVQEVVDAGARCLGENYVEEGAAKITALAGNIAGLEWHMIGHVQSRKAQAVVELFAWLEALDSLKLANRLSRIAEELGRTLPVLLECNVSGEQTKFGWPAWDENTWLQLLGQVEPLLALPNLEVRGLMTMAPYDLEAEAARPYFQRLCRLQAFLAAHFPHAHWYELSMGMSGDYEVAIQEGATIVRIGTAIMGPRTAP